MKYPSFTDNHAPTFINFISALTLIQFVNSSVTITAHQLKVIPIQSDWRIVDVVRIQMNLVVNYLPRLDDSFWQTDFTQAAPFFGVCCACTLPRFAWIELPCVLFHIRQPLRRRNIFPAWERISHANNPDISKVKEAKPFDIKATPSCSGVYHPE